VSNKIVIHGVVSGLKGEKVGKVHFEAMFGAKSDIFAKVWKSYSLDPFSLSAVPAQAGLQFKQLQSDYMSSHKA